MTGKFIAVGECMVEMAVQGDGSYTMGFAGDTFNTAWYARHVGAQEVFYLSAVGDDAPSAQMRAFIETAGITPLLGVREGRSVGLYMISLRDGERSFAYWRDTAAARRLDEDLHLVPELTDGDIVYFSGITLAILTDAGRARLLDAMTAARSAGAMVAFDPNLRPRLWDAAERMCDWTTKGATVADIVLPSFDDEAEHFGDADCAATAERYQRAGARTVIVKDGARPVLIRWDDQARQVAPPVVAHPVDSTAAGDSFNARLLTGVQSGEALEEAVRQACALSVKVIGQHGALVDLNI